MSSAAPLVLGVAGAFVGSFFGAPMLGFMAGSMLGSTLFRPAQEIQRIGDKRLQSSKYGNMISIVFGTCRITGEVIWQTDLVEHAPSGGGKGSGSNTAAVATYTASFAILLHDGQINAVLKVWANGRVVDDGIINNLPYTLYYGTEDQMPDPTMEAYLGAGNVPAHRGYAYAVFVDIDMSQFGNAMPNLAFLVDTNIVADDFTRVATFNPWGTSVMANNQFPGVAFDGNTITTTQYGNHSGSIIAYRVYEHEADGTPISVTTNSLPMFGPLYIHSTLAGLACARGGVGSVWVLNGVTPSSQIVSPIHGDLGTGDDPVMRGLSVCGLFPNQFIVATGSYYTLANGFAPSTFVVRYEILYGVPSTIPTAHNNIFGTDWLGGDQLLTSVSVDGQFVYVRGDSSPLPTFWKFNAADLSLVWGPRVTGTLDGSGGSGAANVGFADQVFWCVDDSIIWIAPFPGTSDYYYTHTRLNNDGTWTTLSRTPLIAPYLYGTSFLHMGISSGLFIGPDGIFSACKRTGVPVILGDIVAAISVRSGMSVKQYEVSQLTDLVDGYLIGQKTAARSLLETLMYAYYFSACESDGRAKFVKHGQASCCTIPPNKLGARASGADIIVQIARSRIDELTLPQDITTVFIDKNFDYQEGSQFWQRMTGDGQTEPTITMPIVMDNAKGKQIADINGFASWLERNQGTIQLSREFAFLEPCDVINVLGMDFRITDCNEQMSRVLEMKVLASLSQIWNNGPQASSPVFVPPTVTPPQLTDCLLLDIQLITDPTQQQILWIAMAGHDRAAWAGGALYESTDGGITYNQVLINNKGPDTFGVTTTALHNFTDGNIFDEYSTVTVVIGNGGGALESYTESQVLGGKGLYSIGDETIAAKTATQIDEHTYTLSGLLRGLFGTERFIGAHAIGDRFCVLPTNNYITAAWSDYGVVRKYKAVTAGNSLASATAIDFTNTGQILLPLAPVLLGAGRNSAGDILQVWVRRTRVNGAWVNTTDEVPVSEFDERYRVRIYTDGSFTTVKRILTTNAPEAIYSAAQQTSDFGHLLTAGNCFWEVQQWAQLGYGTAARSTI